MKEVKTGDIIQVSEKYNEYLKEKNDEIVALHRTIESLSVSIAEKHDKFWEFIREIYPEIKGFVATYNTTRNEILVKTKAE